MRVTGITFVSSLLGLLYPNISGCRVGHKSYLKERKLSELRSSPASERVETVTSKGQLLRVRQFWCCAVIIPWTQRWTTVIKGVTCRRYESPSSFSWVDPSLHHVSPSLRVPAWPPRRPRIQYVRPRVQATVLRQSLCRPQCRRRFGHRYFVQWA